MTDFKQEIEKLLFDLKKINIDRRKIERDLSYREFYLDQALSKGGNMKLYKALLRYYNDKSNIDKRNILEEPSVEYGKAANIDMNALLMLASGNKTAIEAQ